MVKGTASAKKRAKKQVGRGGPPPRFSLPRHYQTNDKKRAKEVLSLDLCFYCLKAKGRGVVEHLHRSKKPRCGKVKAGPIRGPACRSCNAIEAQVLTKALQKYGISRDTFADGNKDLPKGFLTYYISMMKEKFPRRTREGLRKLATGKFFSECLQ